MVEGQPLDFCAIFKIFALKGNALDLAVGVVVGAAFSKIVTAFTEGIMMPLLNPLLAQAGGDWQT